MEVKEESEKAGMMCLLAILILACNSPNLAFHMMYSA